VPGVAREPDPPWITDQRRRLGERVRKRREYANLTQERLVELSGVKRLTLQNIESGATDARFSWLLRIARALDVPVGELLED
jgi:transcriptional regulator with XRE-family HTH domain